MGMRETAMRAIGLVTLLIGVQTFLGLAKTVTQILPTLVLVAIQ